MNRLFFTLAVATSLFFSSCQEQGGNNIPSVSQSFIKTNFPDAEIERVEQDLDQDFEVKLSNGVRITFERRGNWEEINAKRAEINGVFKKVLPAITYSYIEQNYPEQPIRKVERKKYGYLVSLCKPECKILKFSKGGAFIQED